MKSIALVLSLLPLAFAASAHAGVQYECSQNGNPRSTLSVTSAAADGPEILTADWTWGSGTRLPGMHHFTGVMSRNGYALKDENGQDAVLIFTFTPSPHRPCGRGACDFDGTATTTAMLQYLGNNLVFTCH